jgi:hypothetical protein
VRGLTLAEKRNGPGFRERLVTRERRVGHFCAFDGCSDPTWMIAGEAVALVLCVDGTPPGIDAYTRFLRTLPVGVDVEVGLCRGHAEEVAARDLDLLEDPSKWEPGRANPPVIPSPMVLVPPSRR